MTQVSVPNKQQTKEKCNKLIDELLETEIVPRLQKRAADAGVATSSEPLSAESILSRISCDMDLKNREYEFSFIVDMRAVSGLERVLAADFALSSIGAGTVNVVVSQKFTFCAFQASLGKETDRLPMSISVFGYRFDQPNSKLNETGERYASIERRRLEICIYNLLLECCSALTTHLQMSAVSFRVVDRINSIDISFDNRHGLARVCLLADSEVYGMSDDVSVHAATLGALRSATRRKLAEDSPVVVTPICAAWENWCVENVLRLVRPTTATTSTAPATAPSQPQPSSKANEATYPK